jgi:RNA polymerase sigma-70 factor (ECF subfamily)
VAADTRFEHILGAARDGEEWALAALYRSLQPGVLGYLRGQRVRDAEDVASETWIAVARGLARFRGGEDDFRRWVFTIARRRLLDLRRLESRRPLITPAADPESGPQAPDSETEAFASLATLEALGLIAQLPPHEAEIVVLRVIVGLSAEDVAAITGRTTVGVRVAQHRALGRLRGLLSSVLVTLQGRLAI